MNRRIVFCYIALSTMTVAIICGAQAPPAPRGQVQQLVPDHSYNPGPEWLTYKGLSDLIALAPTWPQDRELSAEESARLMMIAQCLQLASVDDVDRALSYYMIGCYEQLHDISERQMAWTRVLLLLRTLFELPDGDPKKWQPEDPLPGPTVCAGIPYKGLQTEVAPSLSLPLSWGESGPRLMVTPEYGPLVGEMYQPQREFRFFLVRFKYRDLSRFTNTSFKQWDDYFEYRRKNDKP